MPPDYLSSTLAGVRRAPKELVTHIDDVPVSRPVPKIERESVMRQSLLFLCPTCQKLGNPSMHKAIDFDYDGQIIKMECKHFRHATLATVNGRG